MDLQSIAKLLGVASLVLAALAVVFFLAAKLGWTRFTGLPGDLHIEGKFGTFSFPVVSSIVVSIVLTILVNLVLWLMKR